MPIYEYRCQGCGRQFEQLVFGQAPQPECPGCQGGEVERLMSTVAVGRSDGRASSMAPGSCGSCGDPRGPGSCRSN